jgi:SAM-dependent methyltransferase
MPTSAPLPADSPFFCGLGRHLQPLAPGGRTLSERAITQGAWRPGATVVDIGCGQGSTLDHLAQRGLVAIGIDLAPASLRQARRADPTRRVIAAHGGVLPLADGCADGAIAECSLSLVPDTASVLSEIHRILRPRARLVITDLFARCEPSADLALPDCLTGIRDRNHAIAALEAAGFDLLRWEDHSQSLATLVGQMIFAEGSLDALWGSTDTAQGWTGALKALRPGYALMVAAKSRSKTEER